MTIHIGNIEGAAVSAPIARRPDGRKGRRSTAHVDKLNLMLARLRYGPATAAEIGALLNVEVSVARRYLVKLGNAGLASTETCEVSARKTHTLTGSEQEVMAYLCSVQLIPMAARKPKPNALAIAKASGRRFHFAGDDEHIMARLHKAPAAPDPLALPVAFFRPAQIDDEPMPRATVAQMARPSFPVPSSFAFQVPT